MKKVLLLLISLVIVSCSKEDVEPVQPQTKCSTVTCYEPLSNNKWCQNRTTNCSGKCYLHD